MITRLQGGRIIDPSQGIDEITDLWIEGSRILGIGPQSNTRAQQVVDVTGLIVVPGLIDMHVHLHEPGDENNETIETGTLAALESGITSLAVMPDTEPAIDNQSSAEFITLQAERAGHSHVFPVGALTKGRMGQELAEMGGLMAGKAVAFSDSDSPVSNPDILRRGLEYASMWNKTVLSRPEVIELTQNGVMNEGFVSVALGMPGIPTAAERIQVDRDINLTKWTGGKLHVQCLTCEGSVQSIRRAKSEGVSITAETCPQYFTLTDEKFRSFDSNYKVNPPLRSKPDVDGIIGGLIDGTIDVIASDHSPWAEELKVRELDVAPFGIIGIETLLPMSIHGLIEPGHLTWPQLIQKLTINPATILGIQRERGTLKAGCFADITVIDPNEEWTIEPKYFKSRSRNTPFGGITVRGRVRMVFLDGTLKFSRGARVRTEAASY